MQTFNYGKYIRPDGTRGWEKIFYFFTFFTTVKKSRFIRIVDSRGYALWLILYSIYFVKVFYVNEKKDQLEKKEYMKIIAIDLLCLAEPR